MLRIAKEYTRIDIIDPFKRYGSVRLVNKDGFSVCIKETINWFGRKNMNEAWSSMQ